MLVFPIGVAAFVAGPPVLTRRARAAAVCFGLLLSSATIVHLMNGAVEGHFHFFVIVTLLALYEDWFTYLLALAFVLLHHGVMGVSVPGTVFNHPSAIEHPWRWAGVHALFVAALSVVNVVSWRLNENARARTVESEERFRSAFEAAPTGMALVERDGTIQRVNAAFASVVGVPGTELARRPLRDLVDADDLAGEHFPAAGAASEARLGRRDGREGWASGTTRRCTTAPARTSAGSAIASTSPSASAPRLALLAGAPRRARSPGSRTASASSAS
jgi:PAS domain S-box-containing protein